MKIKLQQEFGKLGVGSQYAKDNYLFMKVETCNNELNNNAITPRSECKYLIMIFDTIVKDNKEIVKIIMPATRVIGNLKKFFLKQKTQEAQKI